MRIAIVGLGHLGSVTAGCLAQLGHNVLGIDRDRSKVEAINCGQAPNDETGLHRLIKAAWRQGRLHGAAQIGPPILDSELILICVDTPAAKRSLAMKNVLAVCCRLVNLSQEGKEVPPIVIRSTLPPGAYDTTLAPFCPPEGSLRMTYNPEFGREGNAIADFMKPERIVIGVRGRRDALKVQRLYKAVKAPVHVTSWNNAEILKCAENAFHALKVSFANEVGSICESFGAEGDEVMALLCADTRLNISPAYLRPGLPFGGPCLSKDLNALATGALQRSISVPLLRAIPQSNRQHFERIVQAIRKKRSRVEFLGLSHKAGVNDRRGSHLLALAKRLQKEGIEVRTPASQLQQDELSHDQKCSPTRSSERRDRRSDADIVFAPGAVGSVKD